MKNLFKNNIFLFGNLFYLFIFLGFVLYTHPNKEIFDKYSWNYFKGILALLFLWIPYNFFFILPLLVNSIQIKIQRKAYQIEKYPRIIFTLFVWMFLFAFIFISTEVYIRMSPKPKLEDFHPFLQAMNTQKNESFWHVNSDGFRYDEITKDKPKDVYRIFITGGSTVFDEFQPYEKTLVKQVEDLLKKHYPNRKIQVINAGYLRYTSEHKYLTKSYLVF